MNNERKVQTKQSTITAGILWNTTFHIFLFINGRLATKTSNDHVHAHIGNGVKGRRNVSSLRIKNQDGDFGEEWKDSDNPTTSK